MVPAELAALSKAWTISGNLPNYLYFFVWLEIMGFNIVWLPCKHITLCWVPLLLFAGCIGSGCSPTQLGGSLKHAAMDHMAGTSGSGMAPVDSGAEASSSGGMGGMMMMMQMWFQATTEVTLWFREWKVDSHGK